MKELRRSILARRGLLAVLAVAAALRLAVFVAAVRSPSRFWSPDDREYLPIAAHLHAAYVAGSGPLFDLGLRRTPGYPFFIRAIDEALGHHYADVIAVQLLLSVATVCLTYWLAGLVLPRRYALVAAAAVAVDPASIVFANQLLTETLFTLLLVLSVGWTVAGWQRRSNGYAAAAGLVLGVAVLVRPVAEYLPLVLLVVLVAGGFGEVRRAAAIATAFLVGFALPTGAWLFRNYHATGVATISTIDGHNMLQYRAVGALVESGVPRQLAQHEVLVRLAPHVHPGENPARESRAEFAVGLAIVADHPTGAFKDWLRGEAKLLLGPARAETSTLLTGNESSRRLWLRALVLGDQALTVALLLAAAGGVIALILRLLEAPILWVPVSAALYLVAISGGREAYSRFRVPVAPLGAVVGAAALAVLLGARGRRSPRLRNRP